PRVLVEAAGAANRADVTLQPGGDGRGPLPRGDRQDRAGAPDLAPRRGLAPRDGLKEGAVMRSDRQGTGSSTTHGAISRIGTALEAQQRRRLEFRARLRARDTRAPNLWVAHDERPPTNPCRSRLRPPIFGRCGRGTGAPSPARSFTAFAE